MPVILQGVDTFFSSEINYAIVPLLVIFIFRYDHYYFQRFVVVSQRHIRIFINDDWD